MSKFIMKKSLLSLAVMSLFAVTACTDKTDSQAEKAVSQEVASVETTAKYIPTAEELALPVSQYKEYVLSEMEQFVSKTEEMVAAIKAGNLEEAKAIYPFARIHYERLEPAAELFGEYDPKIDAREDDYKEGVNDSNFTGFHRIEYILWELKTTKGAEKFADQLLVDVKALHKLLEEEAIPVPAFVQGAQGLLDEVALTKIEGEEDRYSKTDLFDFVGNVEGSQKIVEILTPLIEKADPELLVKINQGYADLHVILDKYKLESGNYTPYDKVDKADIDAFKVKIATLSEDTATLRGVLGVAIDD